MLYDELSSWVKIHNLILNRCGVINTIHGGCYGWSYGSLCSVRYARGAYECVYCGDVVCTWQVFDLPSADSALGYVSSLADALWLVSRAGMLRTVSL